MTFLGGRGPDSLTNTNDNNTNKQTVYGNHECLSVSMVRLYHKKSSTIDLKQAILLTCARNGIQGILKIFETYIFNYFMIMPIAIVLMASRIIIRFTKYNYQFAEIKMYLLLF